MAKQRIRDIKQGKIKNLESKKKLNALRHAPLRLRIKAFITDTFMIAMPIMYIVNYAVFGSLKEFSQHKLIGWIYILIPLLIVLTLFMLISKEGQTPGMKAYSLALRGLNKDKTPSSHKPGSLSVIFRQIGSILGIVLFGWITMFMRRDRRTLHELLSNTTMVAIEDSHKDD